MTRRDGFRLIEALVALTIAAVALLAIFELQHQLVDGQRRYEAALRGTERQRDALALLRDLNPVERPQGVLPLAGGGAVSWTATPLGPFRTATPKPAEPSLYQVRLYRLRVRITETDGALNTAFDLDRVGWRKG